MAYISDNTKQKIKNNLKHVVPSTWKYSVSFPNRMVARVKITQDDSKIIANVIRAEKEKAANIMELHPNDPRVGLNNAGNPYLRDTMMQFDSKNYKPYIMIIWPCRDEDYRLSTEDKIIINKIIDAINTDNYKKSDIHRHYVECIIYDC